MSEEFAERIARAFDVPPWVVGIGDPPPPRKLSRRERLAAWVGQTGWNTGNLVVRVGGSATLANRITDVGDWLADRLAGR
jgi:hypothetical protein